MRRTKPRQVMVALAAELLPEPLAVRVITAECDRLDAAWKRGTLSVPVKDLLPKRGAFKDWFYGVPVGMAGAIGSTFGGMTAFVSRADRAKADARIKALNEAVNGLLDRG